MLREKTWGLVLSGGGGKGAYEVGVIKALVEAGVKITAVSGASVGALNAALFATYDVNGMIDIWSGITPEIALSQERLADLITLNAIPFLLKRSDIACYVNAYNIFTGENENFHLNKYKRKEIEKLLLASSALPIVYPPVSFRGSLYWDGGILDNTPIEVLYKKGYRNLLVVYLDPDAKKDSYKDAHVVSFAPSEKWGFFDGTLNFEREAVLERIEMGYFETRREILKLERKKGVGK